MRRSAAVPLPAYVLHHYDWSESSLILELFTRDRGRLAVAAKGAKRPYSQLRPVLLPFQRLNVVLGRDTGDGSAEVQTLRSVEWAGGLPMPGGSALFPGFYLNELLLKLLARQDAHPLLFDAYAKALPSLAQADETLVQAALRAFELTLLREAGLLPDLSCVTSTQQSLQPDARYSVQPESGVVVAPDRDGLSGECMVALQVALSHGSAEALREACGGALPVLRSQLRALLHYHLGSSRLRTRQVMADVQRLLDAAPMPRR
jgi:DNA repair protein RecO (recombination protein O)